MKIPVTQSANDIDQNVDFKQKRLWYQAIKIEGFLSMALGYNIYILLVEMQALWGRALAEAS